MRSQIPRPDQRIGKLVKMGGQDVIICDEVWYRYLTAEHTDTAQIEVEAFAALSAQRPNTSKLELKSDEALKLALMAQANYESRIDDLLRRVKALEALTYGR